MPTTAPELEEKPELTDEQRKTLLEAAILKRDKLAESQLDMAKMFIEKGQTAIAKRRLKHILSEFAESECAAEARRLLKRL
jgi:Tfp pilus assembly protein FimV